MGGKAAHPAEERTKNEAVMKLYIGNSKHVQIQKALKHVNHFCFEPVGRGHLPDHKCKVLLDSGAFADVRRGRLSFEHALERQLKYEIKNNFISEKIVSYDLLIDEQLQGDRQIKSRWKEKAGWSAVDVTVAAAEFLISHREELRPRQLVLSCQGVTPEQYIECARRILEIASPEDCFGLGGWCIVGQQRHLAKLFWKAINAILPMIAAAGMKDIHVFGLAYVPLIRDFAIACKSFGLESSNDTTRFYCELSRGYTFVSELGKSLYYSGQLATGRNLALDHQLAIANIEAAYKFFAHIEDWKSPIELFGGGYNNAPK